MPPSGELPPINAVQNPESGRGVGKVGGQSSSFRERERESKKIRAIYI